MLNFNGASFIKTIIILIIAIILGELSNYIEGSTKFKSKERITECGQIEHLYPKQKVSRINVHLFDFKGKNGIIKFYYINNLSTGKAQTNKKEKDNQKIYRTMKVGDKVCITYSPKYHENSYFIGGKPKVPYIFYIEWDRR